MYTKCGDIPPTIAFELFDKMVLPILTYGSEIWGYQYYDTIESVHFSYCKYVIGLSSNAPNMAVLGECGRYPIFISTYIKMLCYWFKLLQMNVTRLPNATYTVLYNLDENGKTNWVTHLKWLLFKYGFGLVFICQGVGDTKCFIDEFKDRLKSCFQQEWSSDINNMSKLKTYCTFKSMLEPEKYLDVVKIKKYRRALSKFRCSNHNLSIETGRRNNIERIDRKCVYCCNRGINVIEDEFHVITKCQLYSDIRTKYICYVRNYNTHDFCSLLKTVNPTKLNELASFLYHVNIIRQQYISSKVI